MQNSQALSIEKHIYMQCHYNSDRFNCSIKLYKFKFKMTVLSLYENLSLSNKQVSKISITRISINRQKSFLRVPRHTVEPHRSNIFLL